MRIFSVATSIKFYADYTVTRQTFRKDNSQGILAPRSRKSQSSAFHSSQMHNYENF